jgi:hypothetical protein
MAYYHADRTHDGLGKDTPIGRAIAPRSAGAELLFGTARRWPSSSVLLEDGGISRTLACIPRYRDWSVSGRGIAARSARGLSSIV